MKVAKLSRILKETGMLIVVIEAKLKLSGLLQVTVPRVSDAEKKYVCHNRKLIYHRLS